jgi:hypothetical protein
MMYMGETILTQDRAPARRWLENPLGQAAAKPEAMKETTPMNARVVSDSAAHSRAEHLR